MVPTYNEAQKYKKSAVLFIFNIDIRIFERMDIQRIQNNIFLIRGHRVMLNFQLAELYGVETRVLKQAENRNRNRFTPDFMFPLSQAEYNSLRSQIVILKDSISIRGKHRKYADYLMSPKSKPIEIGFKQKGREK